jgi:alkylation response protein AidB-like acyl-CoA dehydrogenase
MVLTLQELLRRPGRPSVYEELAFGRVRCDLVHPFPVQSAADRAAGAGIVEMATELVSRYVDPEELEATRTLPAGLVDALRDSGLLKLATGSDLDGHGLSYMNVFWTVAAVATRSVPVALMLAVEAGIGAAALEPLLPPGPVRDEVRARLARGAVTGSADTEPFGASNLRRLTAAVPVEDGAAYLISGEKVHIGNAPIADWMSVTATIVDGPTRLFFFETSAPGFAVKSVHEFMGLKGFPNANLTFDRVRVPREWMLVEGELDRMTPTMATVPIRGRMFLIVAPSLALSCESARIARAFARRRTVNDRGLGEYEEVQRMLAETLADIFAIEALAEWGLVADDPASGVNPIFEQIVAKNVASQACWRVVDRTMSLLAAEGFEVAASKAARGAPPQPMERIFRDARGLRISGGVDFLLDIWLGRYILSSWYLTGPGGEEADDAPDRPGGRLDALLNARNRAHLSAVRAGSVAFAQTCSGLVQSHPEEEDLYARERILMLLSQILNELTTMTLVVARAARLSAEGEEAAQKLADMYCAAARQRMAQWQTELSARIGADGEPPFADLSRAWLDREQADFLVGDIAANVRSEANAEGHAI